MASTPTSCTAGGNWRARLGQRWRASTGEFVPVSLAATAAVDGRAATSRVELRRGATTMTITWPVSAAADFAAWMRELLR